MFDIAVIGAGLLGSAALRHLTVSFPELRVCAIGPAEPKNRKMHQGVFASHYDQGRITRVLDPSPLWGRLARESIAEYAKIEAASGIVFHHRAGCLRATDLPERIVQMDACAEQLSSPHSRLDDAGCRAAHPYLRFSDSFVAWDEVGEAGYINPRQLAAAQLAAAQNNGAQVIREIVDAIRCEQGGVTIYTRKPPSVPGQGEAIRARKILLCAGGYSNTLLDRKLSLRTKGHTILLAEVPVGEVERLRAMPAVISAFAHKDVSSLYMLPPVPYPDGKTYIKLGFGDADALPLPEPYFNAVQDDRELLDWFHTDGRQDLAEALKEALHRMLPGLNALSYHSVPCLITHTAHGNPYIDALDAGRMYVATGGNGAAAKSSDAIGRLGAMLCATGEWRSQFNRAEFHAVYADGGSK
ncbi:MAG: FAD-dependent oxidoreductase [Chloroflexi bacterium]|nr:FAD-dependent oxidoreductase [Chloroflexota bacterium]MCY3583687.1 FAD-dependent oxidoreductase [Chloroflexota bacterium]MCY3716967.1 FAD-dependent oxidoreductase [Chloroflexota bacterium]MDE2650151.1 FAD-dependent oxidoreductase [Chloroflexota bacterium]MXX83660.1 FAD-binding oxidoreductase [Chloroflexota bacterium]